MMIFPLPNIMTAWQRTVVFISAILFCSATLAQDEQSISIVGNNELPSTQFIIPWKDSESPLIPDRPVNSLVNQSLMPVDPEIFRRKLDLYNKNHQSD